VGLGLHEQSLGLHLRPHVPNLVPALGRGPRQPRTSNRPGRLPRGGWTSDAAEYAAGMTATGRASGYSLTLSEDELRRYRFMADAARQTEQDLWQVADIAPGATVADIGCGPGALFPAVMDAIGPGGRLIGVDENAKTVAAAQAMIDANAWPNATVQVGRAEATGLPDGSLDVAMVRHVLGHNGPTEQQIVNHLAALIRPGGHLYLVDVDASMFRIRPSDPDVESLDETYRAFHAARGNDLEVGLRLSRLLTAAGLEVAAYRGWIQVLVPTGEFRPPAWAAREAMKESGFASDADIARWDTALTALTADPPTIFFPIFGAVGRRPARIDRPA
jgi:ubiquinone/menaquinone biosynthesis C-methylase UbiE